jgi:saccharopine dehydrogenase-like NADP-dependent oxidoreductase
MDVVTGRTRVAVLGGGLVGGYLAKLGSRIPEWHVTLHDKSRPALDKIQKKVLVSTNQADLTDKDVVQKCVEEADLVIVALPGSIGFKALEWVLLAGKNAVDISFCPEDPLRLQDIAEARQVVAVVDCGVMPGLGGMVAANFSTRLNQTEALKIMVGGIPADRENSGPFQYRAPFSPADVIEEYTRPARLRVNGEVVVAAPMSDVESVSFPGVGELEAFNTDGLRTLLDTLDVPNMVEKTLRYPGHTAKIEFLRELGYFGTEPVRTGGQRVRPLDVTTAVLTKAWQIGEEEDELTAMSIEVEGIKDGRRIRHRCELLDRTEFDGTLSMARTTAFPAMLAAKLILAGKIEGPGIIPAERFGLDEAMFREFMSGFLRYGLKMVMTQRDMGAADDPVSEPLVLPPTKLWEEPQAESAPEAAPPRAAAVAAVATAVDQKPSAVRAAAAGAGSEAVPAPGEAAALNGQHAEAATAAGAASPPEIPAAAPEAEAPPPAAVTAQAAPDDGDDASPEAAS